jgi:hypothetical protein
MTIKAKRLVLESSPDSKSPGYRTINIGIHEWVTVSLKSPLGYAIRFDKDPWLYPPEDAIWDVILDRL